MPVHNNFIVFNILNFACIYNFSGESVTFQCDLSRGNISRLHVTWYEKAGNGQERLISNSNDSLSLTLQGNPSSGMESHVTRYRCTVRNTDGLGSSPSAKLVILRTGNLERSFCSAGIFCVVHFPKHLLINRIVYLPGDKAVCEREVSYGVTWSVTSAGMIDIQPCPNATGKKRFWYCTLVLRSLIGVMYVPSKFSSALKIRLLLELLAKF